MKYLVAALLLSSSLLFAPPMVAGPGHDHGDGHSHSHSRDPVSRDVAIDKALERVKKLVEAGKIDASWSSVEAASVEQKTFSNKPEWVVTFKNDQVSDASKQTLYLFYTLDGRYIAANYTGN